MLLSQSFCVLGFSHEWCFLDHFILRFYWYLIQKYPAFLSFYWQKLLCCKCENGIATICIYVNGRNYCIKVFQCFLFFLLVNQMRLCLSYVLCFDFWWAYTLGVITRISCLWCMYCLWYKQTHCQKKKTCLQIWTIWRWWYLGTLAP